VTETDHGIQAGAVATIRTAYPEHAIIAEEAMPPQENLPDPTTARYCWVLDPLDGTRNYAAGFPCYATSIGVLDRGVPIAGVIREHCTGNVYEAIKGDRATLNGNRMGIGDVDSLPDLMVGVSSSKDELTVRVVSSWARQRGIVLRNVGSTAVHLGLVACGALAAAFCKRCKIWDIAAGVVILGEAGGMITDPRGHPIDSLDLQCDPATDTPFLASAPSVHQQLLDQVLEAARAAATE